ncbi:hypothetical protein [Microvirga sp. M2]|uniref:hypothetical protein n=1 Tax=Microvirga sp. M2 TaxID=3073270 RepID=UPI0039C3E84C
MTILHRSGVCALALMAGTAAMRFEPAVLRDLVAGGGSHEVSIGAVRTSLWSAAFAQTLDSFTLENVRFSWGGADYEAKQMTFTGVSVPRSDIESLFSAGSGPLADKLARINAKKVSIPELRITQKLGQDTQISLHRNVSLNDIVQGRIASAMVEASAIEGTDKQGKSLISYGRISVSDVDMPAFVKLYDTKGASGPLTKIYGAFSIEKIDMADAGGDYHIQVARIGGRDIMARPTQDSWNGTLAAIDELAQKDETTPEERTRLMHIAADLLSAFDAGLVEATGITFKGDGKDNKGTGSIARLAYTGAAGQQPSEMRMEGIDVGDADGRVKVGAISLSGFSLAPTIEALKSLDSQSLTDLDSAALRSLVPTLGTLRMTDLDIDASSEDGDKPGERIRVVLGLMELTADKPVNGIPTNIRFEQRNVSTTLPEDSDDELVQQLQALGYKSVDGSLVIAASWNEAAKEIAITELSMDGKDMGSLRMTGLMGNVSPDLFSTDGATASAALIGVKAKAARVTIENKGLFERYLANAAKEEGASPEALRKLYAGATPLVLSSMIGNSEQAQSLGKAIARFIEKPGRLTIDAEPKNPSGFGVMDVVLTSDPKALMNKLKITAKAE